MESSDLKILILSFAAFITTLTVLISSKAHYIKNNLVEEFNKGYKIKCYLDEDSEAFMYIDNTKFYYKKYKFISKDGDIHLSAFKCHKG